MIAVVWIVFLLVMLFVLGSTVGSFLNVCIVRLPQGRSLIRPASSCGQCGKPIRIQDNIPLLSYWLLRGRCRACGATFSMRYFWIELLTGLLFVLIYYLEIGRNVHHFQLLAWYENDYSSLLMDMFRPGPWLVFSVHALLSCFLIVATMTSYEEHKVPRSVTLWGVLLGLLAAVLFPWPWPDEAAIRYQLSAIGQTPSATLGRIADGGQRIAAGLYPWPIWAPLPDWLPPNSRRLGLATGLAGVLAGAILMGMVRLAFNFAAGAAAVGWDETSLLMIAGGFLGWQPIVVAGLLGLIPGLIAAMRQWMMGKRVAFSLWLALAVAGVWLGWYWFSPLVQGLFFNPTRLSLLLAGWVVSLIVLGGCLRRAAIARPTPRP
ncbi:MAG TPA: prepilin peptidase [Gemmataceae bacterium]|nr:prepilin peptidase [Gemmataceae bacterium]